MISHWKPKSAFGLIKFSLLWSNLTVNKRLSSGLAGPHFGYGTFVSCSIGLGTKYVSLQTQTGKSLHHRCKQKSGRQGRTIRRQTAGRRPSHADMSSPFFDSLGWSARKSVIRSTPWCALLGLASPTSPPNFILLWSTVSKFLYHFGTFRSNLVFTWRLCPAPPAHQISTSWHQPYQSS